ncbi:hypothetical protein Pfo_022697 [Paulownia fortunei]|nr:hypothetical protein Pfo_022697 [Paulownia fortunei]
MFLHLLLTFFQGAAPESTGFSLKLIPWDSPKSPLHQPNLTQIQKIQMMAMSSKARANSPTPKNGTFYADDAIQIPVKNQGLQYSVNIQIGNPGTEVTLLLDTGSGPIWTQCQQSKFYFNPMKSKTYKALSCQHPLCQKDKKLCKCINGQCVCSLSYGIKGGKINQIDAVLSSDSFTLPIKNNGYRTFTNMIFGCSSQSPVFSGILGLDKLPISLISQVRNKVQGRYSYCLYGGDGYLRFGNNIPQVRKDAKTTRILHPHHPTMFLGLTDVSVAQKRLGLSPALFSYEQGGFLIDTGAQLTVLKKQAYNRVIKAFANYYNGRLKRSLRQGLCALDWSLEIYRYWERCSSGIQDISVERQRLGLSPSLFALKNGGVLMDTGVQYTVLTKKAYNKVNRAFQSYFKGRLEEIDRVYWNLKPCYRLTPGFNDYPTMTFHFEGADFEAEYTHVKEVQQWNTRFMFDINENVLKFYRDDCAGETKE